MTIIAQHYTYRVHWSPEDDMYVGTVAELPLLSWLASDQMEAFAGIYRVASETIEDLEADGDPVPPALADRQYSGKFMVRVPPEVHRQLAIEAAEQNVSLNRLAVSRLVRV